ncbi:hypothetical protein MRX96_044535 [Rhipicephalus microplus]
MSTRGGDRPWLLLANLATGDDKERSKTSGVERFNARNLGYGGSTERKRFRKRLLLFARVVASANTIEIPLRTMQRGA